MKNKSLFVLGCVGALFLAGCTDSSTTNTGQKLDPVTNLTFDATTGTYNFTGSENATFYSFKVYQYTTDTEIDSHAVASSGIIKATEENTTYTGTLDYSFVAGKYRAVCKALAPRYTSSQAELEFTSNLLGAPDVTASITEGQGDQESTIDITITATDTVTQTYTVTVADTTYNNAAATAGQMKLTATDLGIDAIDVDATYTITVVNNPVDGYTTPAAVTVQATKPQQGGPGGGGGGGGGGDWKLTYSAFSFEAWADTFEVAFGEQDLLKFTATKAETANEGASYTYNLTTHDTAAPFAADINSNWHMDFMADNTMTFTMTQAGPLAAGTKSATWALDGTTVNVTWVE